MPATSRKRKSSASSNNSSEEQRTPPSRGRRQSPKEQRNSLGNRSLNTSANTPSKFLGSDRAGLEPYLIERRERKEAREQERKEREREDRKRRDKKQKNQKMKPDIKPEKKADVAPNYEKSGLLNEEQMTYKGIKIKYSEPQEARIPKTKWRLYPFKGEDALPTMYIHRNSGYLIGRERKIVDIPSDHPSCSAQHAVIQFRLVDHVRQDGSETKKVKPYLMDLESTNGTFLNNEKIEGKRYYELKEKDIIKFGFSTREYVLLHEHSEGVSNLEN